MGRTHSLIVPCWSVGLGPAETLSGWRLGRPPSCYPSALSQLTGPLPPIQQAPPSMSSPSALLKPVGTTFLFSPFPFPFFSGASCGPHLCALPVLCQSATVSQRAASPHAQDLSLPLRVYPLTALPSWVLRDWTSQGGSSWQAPASRALHRPQTHTCLSQSCVLRGRLQVWHTFGGCGATPRERKPGDATFAHSLSLTCMSQKGACTLI